MASVKDGMKLAAGVYLFRFVMGLLLLLVMAGGCVTCAVLTRDSGSSSVAPASPHPAKLTRRR